MMFRRAGFLVAASLLASFSLAHAQPAQLPTERLYKGAAPGSEKWKFPEIRRETPQGISFSNVRDPEFTPYLPDPAKANGAAIVYLPGGSLRGVGFGAEAKELIQQLNDRGVAVITLKYRTLQMDPAAPRPSAGGPALFDQKFDIKNGNANPLPNDPAQLEIIRLSTADAQETLRRVRKNAKAWRIDPARVGVFATSAGGGPAFGAMMAGEAEAAPSFIISNFAPALQPVSAGPNAPPLFIVTETPHGAVTEGVVQLLPIWQSAKRPVELHVYDVPNFTMSWALWGERMVKWMQEQKIIP